VVLLEDIAAPLLMLVHVMSGLLGSGIWLAGVIVMVRTIKTGRFDDLRKTATITLLIGATMFAVLLISGALIYPTFRVYIRGGAYGLDAVSPYSTFEFELKEWVASSSIFSAIGAVIIAATAENRAKAYSSIVLAMLTIVLVAIAAWLAVDIGRAGLIYG